MPIDKTPKPRTPEQQIKALQVQLAQAQEKAKLFEAVLEVLKKDFGVRVRRSKEATPHTPCSVLWRVIRASGQVEDRSRALELKRATLRGDIDPAAPTRRPCRL